ncbi:class I adenylate-forming enzyme family protein [Actinopolymorpha alba]|uniref:class I adenylate-forming enzyme family protein n=1 Tax=Actinopolymorpha alba TaxID=533267 RepID=UPI000370B558|nr:AMP-binding protein [Actinopolymorpha alba]
MAISRDVTRRAAADPHRPAVVGPAGVLSFGELAARASRRAEELAASGVGPEDAVVTTDEDAAGLLVDLVAADLLGAAAVVTDATWPADLRTGAVEAARSAVERIPKSACLAVFTSGSTRTPRPVVRTRESWTFSFPTFSALTGIGADDTVLIPGRLSGSLFLFGALHALTMGAAIHPLPHWSPELAVRAAASCTAVHVVPPMLASLADRLAPEHSRLRLAVCGGAHLDPRVEEAASKAGLAVIDYYGAAELSFVAIRRPGRPAGQLRAFPGVEVDLRDGVIWARSPYLALGLDCDPEGFASVGDHGVLDDNGTLTVLGRAGAAITSGGSTISPEAVESTLRQVPGVADLAVVGRPHAQLGEVVVAVVEPSAGTDVPLTALRAAAAQLARAQRPRLWYAVNRLPRTGSGKVARARVLAGLADGTLGVQALT